ncbi:MAG: acetyl-CoA carboxylase biotin carboxyl carrier protein subunit [Propioniciclava sp.]
MRRYTLTVNDTTMVIDVEAAGADLFRVQLDGRLIDVRLDDHRDLAHSAVTPAITAPAPPPRPAATTPARETTGSTPPPHPRPASPQSAQRRAAGGGAAAGGRDKVTAPMPGVILSVAVQPGASVRRGETLMVLEAMKMKNDLKATRDAVVAEIYVAAGAQVTFGETLVRFE